MQLARSVIVGLVLLGATIANAEVELRLSSEPDRIFAGSHFSVKVVIRKQMPDAAPEAPDIRNASIAFVGRNSMNFMGNRTETFTYRVTPDGPGPLTIPGFTLRYSGRPRTTNELQVNVQPAPIYPDTAEGDDGAPMLSAEIVSSASQLYLGQSVTLRLIIKARVPEARGEVSAQFVYEQLRNSNPRVGFGAFSNPRNAGVSEQKTNNGRRVRYYEIELESVVNLDRQGPLRFDELQIGYDYANAVTRDVFGRMRASREKLYIVTPKVNCPDVEVPPRDDQPANYSGAVGKYKISGMVKNQTYRVGDPIELNLTVTGNGALDLLACPNLSGQPNLAKDFAMPEEFPVGRTLGEAERGNQRRLFQPVIRPKRAGITEIPPIELPYFDPLRGTYEVARTRPIEISVQATETVTANDLLQLQTPDEGGDALTVNEGLIGNSNDVPKLLRKQGDVSWASLITVTALPPVAFGGLWLMALMQRGGANPDGRRRERALATAQAALAAQPEAGDIIGILTNYVADRSAAPEGSLTGPDTLRILEEHGANPQLLDSIRSMLEAAEEAAYGGLPCPEDITDHAQAVLIKLEQLKW